MEMKIWIKKLISRRNNIPTDASRSTSNFVSQTSPTTTSSCFEVPAISETIGPASDVNDSPFMESTIGQGHQSVNQSINQNSSNEQLTNEPAPSRKSPTAGGGGIRRSSHEARLDALEANLRILRGESLCSTVATSCSRDSRGSHRTKADEELRHLGGKTRRVITELLDANKGWQGLANSILHPDPPHGKLFPDITVLSGGVNSGKVDSPSDEILKTWSTTGRNRPLVRDFYELLVKIAQLRMADKLLWELGLDKGDISGGRFPESNTDDYLNRSLNFANRMQAGETNMQPDLPDLFAICSESMGKAISDFSIQSSRKIGEGAYGLVYKVLIDGEEMAVKLLKKNPGIFFNEIEKLSQIKHPNLLELVGVCEHDKTPCIVTKYMQNGNLKECLNGKNMSWPLRHRVLKDIASALEYLHSLDPQIVHRDIKTANILLDKDMNAFLGDFGLARSKNSSHTSFTQGAPGTACYMSHEAFNGIVDTRNDVYAFGIVIFEVLTGLAVRDPQGSRASLFYHQQGKPLMELLDSRIPPPGEFGDELLELGRRCSENQYATPSMQEVVGTLRTLEELVVSS